MSVIVLNTNYEYWDEITDLKKVIKWYLKDKIQIVVEKEEEYNSVSLSIKIPAVVRLLGFVGFKIKSDHVPYSKTAVYNRDNNICQYWHYDESGHRFKYLCTENERTVDHVTPTSRGGKTNFENCVCSCRDCNERIKKNRLPQEAGLELIRKPFVPRGRRGEMFTVRFVYNPKKLSHRYYMEKVLGKEFSHRA